MAYNFEVLKELDDDRSEIKSFIDSSNKTILDEEIKLKITIINQLMGYYNQILVRVQDIIPKEEFNSYIAFKDKTTKKITSLENEDNSKVKLTSLNEIYNELLDTYNTLNSKTLNIIENDNFLLEYNNLIKKANEVIMALNNTVLSKSLLESLMPLYNEVKNTRDINIITSFINRVQEVLSNYKEKDINAKFGKENERVFSLFAKINDQIVDSTYINNSNLVYASYTLEDGSKYYAIIKEEKEIEILNQSFSSLPNLVLTKDNIIDTCKLIIKNAGIYYDINEYMRYIEKSYKTRMTKEIDDLILKYKTRLQELENAITIELSFIDDIALLAFPQTDFTIVVASLAAQEMYDDLLALKRAALISNKTREDYYNAMVDDIEVEKIYLDKRAAFFKKALGRLESMKQAKESANNGQA